jgi:hypothetical protein
LPKQMFGLVIPEAIALIFLKTVFTPIFNILDILNIPQPSLSRIFILYKIL